MTLDEIITDLHSQIAWRGPGGQPQGYIVLPRSDAIDLLTYLIATKKTLENPGEQK